MDVLVFYSRNRCLQAAFRMNACKSCSDFNARARPVLVKCRYGHVNDNILSSIPVRNPFEGSKSLDLMRKAPMVFLSLLQGASIIGPGDEFKQADAKKKRDSQKAPGHPVCV